jgi:chemotaxis protein MotB
MPRKKPLLNIRNIIDPGPWMVPYGNLMTILMIFFVILYAFAYRGGVTYEKALALLEKDIMSQEQQRRTTKSTLQEAELALALQRKLQENTEVQIDAQRIKILLPSPVLFASGQANLKKEASITFHELAKSLKPMPNHIIVEGHTDNVPIGAGEFESNWELSAARAFSVIRYFVDIEGIEPDRFTAYGYGEYNPIAPNDTEENRAKNRRIEISILRQ